MNESFRKPDASHGILLATDLSGRCDRALDRATLLAARWNARLVAMTTVESDAIAPEKTAGPIPDWYRQEDETKLAARDLCLDTGMEGVQCALRVETGHVGRNVLRVAEEEGCALIVTGVARYEALGRMVLGSTVDWLVRHSSLPVLIVRNRARGDYRNMVMASDWSDSSRHALETALRLFPDVQASVVHGFDVPHLGLRQTSRTSAMEELRAQALTEGRAFLDRCTLPANHGSPKLVAEHGDPARLVRMYARQHDADLITIGTHGHSVVFDVLIGSVARRILESSPVDTLVVRAPASKPEAR